MITSEKQLSTQGTTDTLDEIYTNYDISVSEKYLAQTGYPFDYSTRWLNDPSQNKWIAIRRLDVTLSTHSFTLTVSARWNRINEYGNPIVKVIYEETATIDVTHADTLVKVLHYICLTFSYADNNGKGGGLTYEYNVKTNQLILRFLDTGGVSQNFSIDAGPTLDNRGFNDELQDFLQFLNQPVNEETRAKLKNDTKVKTIDEVWSRDRIHFHASFSTLRWKFISKRGDFYQNFIILYPIPTNESSFYIHFTSNGMKNILIRYCEFDTVSSSVSSSIIRKQSCYHFFSLIKRERFNIITHYILMSTLKFML